MLLELTLTVPIVQPLLTHMRSHAAVLERTPSHQTELTVFFSLFPPEFAKKGVILIDRDEVIWTLRACALLRRRLRETDLATLSEAAVDSGRTDEVPEALRQPLLAYRFLATLQRKILAHYPPDTFMMSPWARKIRRWIARVQDAYGTREPAAEPPLLFGVERVPSDPDGQWQVVVRNDPVNLMEYVAAAFRLSLGLSEKEATERTSEVHERGQAMAWRGSREEAELFAAALCDWHLRAEVTWARDA